MKMSEIIDMRTNGATYQEIADAVGLSKQRVREIILKHSPELKGTRGSALRRANDQVNRLQAEIERLEKGELRKAMTFNNETIKSCTHEAIKEFAERLKNEIISDTAYGCDSSQHSGYYDYTIKIGDIPEYIDNLVKEMTEQSTGYGSSKTER